MSWNKVLVLQNRAPVYEELPITGTLYPTYLAKIVEDSGVTKLAANDVQGAPCLVVREDEHGMGGNVMGTLISTACSGRATAAFLAVGDQIVVTVVDGLTVTKGDLLTSSATAGKVGSLLNTANSLVAAAAASQPSQAGTISVVAAQLVLRAEEALLSDATTRRILCRVLRG